MAATPPSEADGIIGFGQYSEGVSLTVHVKLINYIDMHYKRIINCFNRMVAVTAMLMAASAFTACSDDDDEPDAPDVHDAEHGLFVVCEGNYGASNSSLTWYNTENNTYSNEVFRKANNVPLGSQAQSMTIHDDDGWVVVCDSHVIFEIDLENFKEEGRITGLTQPRYIHFVSDTKAYVTMMNSKQIAIVNPETYSITGYIDLPDMYGAGDAAMMVQDGNYVYVNCWSYQNKIVRINTRTDKVDASLVVGVQPKVMCMDRNKDLWVVTDGGGWEQNPAGYEAPAIVKVDTRSFEVEKRFELPLGTNVGSIAVNRAGNRLYWICNGVYSMAIDSDKLPEKPLIEPYADNAFRFYGLGVSPRNGHIFVADAKDYVQNGEIFEYDEQGNLIHSFESGICPRFFSWYDD